MAQDVGSGKSRRGRPVELGGALVTLVEPHRGHEVAYNRWYERDHFYAGCMVGAWTLAGARYVATRDLKALRAPDSTVAPDPSAGSYLSLYWLLAGRFGEWMEWGTRQVRWLIDEDRMFPHRDHVHTVMYRFAGEVPGRRDGVPVELALDHRSPWLAMVLIDRVDGVSSDDVARWWAEASPGAEVTAVFEPVPMPDDAPSDVPAATSAERTLLLAFVDDDLPARWAPDWAELPSEVTAQGLGRVAFASPFLATVPGTDTYADELWD